MKIADVKYMPFSRFLLQERVDDLTRYLRLAAEYGAGEEGRKLFLQFEAELEAKIDAFEQLVLAQSDPDEPDSLEEIRALRPDGPRRLTGGVPAGFAGRLRGAFYGRMAGCTLGAALEFQPLEAMEGWAKYCGDSYPLTDYWSMVKEPTQPHYITGMRTDLTKGHMDAVPPDDDTIYTLLGLLVLEQYGMGFTLEEMAAVWKRYLPLGEDGDGAHGNRGCWWGERRMLKNLLAGMGFPEAGLRGNPNLQSIAAWTRADSYGYACPGWPEQAAALAWKDASANHRRNGVYGAMFMAAAIAAAFAVDDPMEAVRIGLSEIPRGCLFAEGIRWALGQCPKDYREAAHSTWEIYHGMFNGSALTNAIHVVMGLRIGGRDFTKVIGQTVAMGGDNDCTGATAGSIAGAVIGRDFIPANWTDPFRGRMHIYLKEHPEYLDMEAVCARFEALAAKFRG